MYLPKISPLNYRDKMPEKNHERPAALHEIETEVRCKTKRKQKRSKTVARQTQKLKGCPQHQGKVVDRPQSVEHRIQLRRRQSRLFLRIHASAGSHLAAYVNGPSELQAILCTPKARKPERPAGNDSGFTWPRVSCRTQHTTASAPAASLRI